MTASCTWPRRSSSSPRCAPLRRVVAVGALKVRFDFGDETDLSPAEKLEQHIKMD